MRQILKILIIPLCYFAAVFVVLDQIEKLELEFATEFAAVAVFLIFAVILAPKN